MFNFNLLDILQNALLCRPTYIFMFLCCIQPHLIATAIFNSISTCCDEDSIVSISKLSFDPVVKNYSPPRGQTKKDHLLHLLRNMSVAQPWSFYHLFNFIDMQGMLMWTALVITDWYSLIRFVAMVT